ncbi:hypothetical protein ABID56_002345 [Alkalibacillus flavidus]|uniref:NERD domain-containing protein n=1 Tax=Alkalibacillus flavidus TaxID=546021 RepID=A0ABV2KXV0_9BACI
MSGYFQTDLLVVTARFMLIVEAKHLKGELSINESGQLLQRVDGVTEVYGNPLVQAEIQRYQLEKLLQRHGFDHPPIYTCAAFTHDKAILNIPDPPHNLMTSQRLFEYYQMLYRSNRAQLSRAEVTKLAVFLKDQHTPLDCDVMADFGVRAEWLAQGVPCECCDGGMMRYHYTKWICGACGCVEAEAHWRGLRAFAVIFRTMWVTNKQARAFLGIRSRSTCQRLLASLPMEGERSTARYCLEGLFR